MPQNLEELFGEKLRELEQKINLKNTEVQDLSLDLNTLKGLIKNHRHQGLETIPIETIIKNAQYVDGKEFRARGTPSIADGTYSVVTITTKGGIVTAITV